MISSKKFEAIGSIISIKIDYDEKKFSDSEMLFNRISEELIRFESDYSRFKDTSKLSYANSNLHKWIDVNEEFLYLIKKSLEYNKKTKGYFDITVKSILDKIGYDKNYSFKEKITDKTKDETKNFSGKNFSIGKHFINKFSPNSLAKKFKSKFLKPILVDDKNSKILLRKEIDLGGIGKGYILDRIAEIISSFSIDKYYINGGGDILVLGEWTILLEHPDNTKIMLGKIILKDAAIASSSSNRRNWNDGKHHHLINPKTGKSSIGSKSTFVICKSGMDADVYATSLFVAGFLKSIRLSKTLSLDVMLISQDNQYYVSSGFNAELFG